MSLESFYSKVQPVKESPLKNNRAVFEGIEVTAFLAILSLGMGACRSSLISTEPGELAWTIDEGHRLDEASNPRIMSYDDGVVELLYEYRAEQLYDEPGANAYLTYSEDGLNFDVGEPQEGDEYRGDGITLLDGTQRRYFEDMDEGCVRSQTYSERNQSWILDEGFRYDLNEIDGGWMGVRTFWVNEDGGVGFVYNTNTILQPDGSSSISVRMAYSEPEDMGMNFELVNENLINEQDENGFYEMAADPVAITFGDGLVRLLVMRQAMGDMKPPAGRTGEILSYISEDGFNFDFEESVVHWSEFEEWEVHSLNDPKIMELEDGRFRVYVAAQVPDPDAVETGEVEKEDGTMYYAGFKWILASVTEG